MQSIAFWISPSGHVADVGATHIEGVVSHPEKFGLTREFLLQTLQQTNAERAEKGLKPETLSTEGDTREKIIRELLSRGFIRVRKYANRGYSISVWSITGRVHSVLKRWAQGMLGLLASTGFHGMKETDQYATVSIVPIDEAPFGKDAPAHAVQRLNMFQLASYGTSNEAAEVERTCSLKEAKIEDWPDLPSDRTSVSVMKVVAGVAINEALF